MNLQTLKPHLQQIREHQEPMLNRVIEWSEVNSGSSNAEGLESMLELLVDAFRELGPEPTLTPVLQDTPGRAMQIKCRPEAPLRIFFSGHYDTVYPADHPFQRCTDLGEGKLQGPGVADMKGGLVILLEALRTLEAFPDKEAIGWEVLISPDEETGSVGSSPYLEEGARNNHLGLIFEPALSGGDLARARPGSATYICSAKGKAAHVGRHFDEGRSALFALVRFSAEMKDFLESLPGGICNLGKVEGGGPVNVVPDQGSAHFNFRVASAADAEALETKLQALQAELAEEDEIEISYAGGFTRNPKEISPATTQIFSSLSACATSLGFPLQWRDTGGCCDGNNLASAGLPTIDTLGVRGGRLHSPDEFMEVDSLVERAELTALYLLALATREAPWPTD